MPEPKPPLTLITRCAWCPAFPVPPGSVVSHGICPEHMAEMLREAEALRAKRAA